MSKSETYKQDLILFCVYSVMENKEICTFERLVAECFKRFPSIFGFKRYPQWPDSSRLDRDIRTLRNKGFITGNVKTYISLTEFGERKARRIKEKLEKGQIVTKDKGSDRSVDDRLLSYLRNTNLFKKYREEGENIVISEAEFRDFLRCTLETPERVLRQNLSYYKNIAKEYNESCLQNFLEYCEKKFFKRSE